MISTGTLLVLVFALVALLIITKATEMKHHIFYKFLGVLGILFALSLAYIWIRSGSNISTYEGFLSFGRAYFTWLSNLFWNAKGITGYAAQQGWGINSSVIPGLG